MNCLCRRDYVTGSITVENLRIFDYNIYIFFLWLYIIQVISNDRKQHRILTQMSYYKQEEKNVIDIEKSESSSTVSKQKRRCVECGNPHIKYKFCIICQKQYFIRWFDTWTSNNNSKIDWKEKNAIVHVNMEFFEWISWEDMDLIEHESDYSLFCVLDRWSYSILYIG